MREEVQKISLSIATALIIELYNQYSIMLLLMGIAIVLDVITGLIKAKCLGEKISKKTGWKGFWKKSAFIATFSFGVFLDFFIPYALKTTGVDLTINCGFGLIIGAYITLNESISICENLYLCNPDMFPKWLVNILKSFKEKIDKSGKGE
jgi:toxin secretion/phage lysis holin